MKKILILLTILAVLPFVTAQEPSTYPTVSGKLLDRITGNPLADTKIFTDSIEGTSINPIYTDSNGYFSYQYSAEPKLMHVLPACNDQFLIIFDKAATGEYTAFYDDKDCSKTRKTFTSTNGILDMGDIYITPVVGMSLHSDVPISFMLSSKTRLNCDALFGGGNSRFKNEHFVSLIAVPDGYGQLSLKTSDGKEINSDWMLLPSTGECKAISTYYVNGEFGIGEPPEPTYQCSDGLDNDGDGLTDMNDPGCEDIFDDDEYNAPEIPEEPDMGSCLDNPLNYWDQETDKCHSGYEPGIIKNLCSDPDGGKDIYEYAHTFGFRSSYADERDKRIRTGGSDACLSDGRIVEHFCDENGFIQALHIDCPGICRDGVCIGEVVPPPPTPGCEPIPPEKIESCLAAGGQPIKKQDSRGCTFISCAFGQIAPPPLVFLQEAPTMECQAPEEMNRIKKKCDAIGLTTIVRGVNHCNFVECIEWPTERELMRGDERFMEYKEILELPEEAKILAAVLKMEKLKIQFDKLQKDLEEIAEYYNKTDNLEEAQKFYRAAAMIALAQEKLTSIKDDLRDRISSLTVQDIISAKRDLKYITQVVFRDILYMILGGEEKAPEEYGLNITREGIVDCGREEQCFKQYFRVCKPAKAKPEEELTLIIEGIEGKACILLAEGPEGKDMKCKIPNYAFAKLDDEDDILPYCEGPMAEVIKKPVVEEATSLKLEKGSRYRYVITPPEEMQIDIEEPYEFYIDVYVTNETDNAWEGITAFKAEKDGEKKANVQRFKIDKESLSLLSTYPLWKDEILKEDMQYITLEELKKVPGDDSQAVLFPFIMPFFKETAGINLNKLIEKGFAEYKNGAVADVSLSEVPVYKNFLAYEITLSPRGPSEKKASKFFISTVKPYLLIYLSFPEEMNYELEKVETKAFELSEYDDYYIKGYIPERSEDARVCEKITDIEERDGCYRNIAARTEDYSVCERIIGSGRKSWCYRDIAEITEDTSACDKIASGDSNKDFCYIGVAIKAKDSNACEKITDKDLKDRCHTTTTAILTKNPSLCEEVKMTISYAKDWCYWKVAEGIKDAAVCEEIAEKSTKENCHYDVAKVS